MVSWTDKLKSPEQPILSILFRSNNFLMSAGKEDVDGLQRDIDRLCEWTNCWQNESIMWENVNLVSLGVGGGQEDFEIDHRTGDAE